MHATAVSLAAMSKQAATRSRVTPARLAKMKARGEKIVMVTAYDATFAALAEMAQVDVVLVGDSLGMVMQGGSHTLEVSLRDMIYHSRCVASRVDRAHLVVDMPFLSYQVSPREALRGAGALISKGGAHAVKLEGGADVAGSVKKIVRAGIPVMGHLGLTPQHLRALGGFVVQGKSDTAIATLVEDALRLQDAGVYSIVLEGMTVQAAQAICDRVELPTIGIGAGPMCDGQVLVMQDLLGLDKGWQPRFVKHFAELGDEVRRAIEQYGDEVRNASFPQAEHCFHRENEEGA